MFKRRNPPLENPWTDDPLVAYKNFLKYTGQEVNEYVQRDDLKVHTYEAFYPLKMLLDVNNFCSKITIRNVTDATLVFDFADDVIPRILGIKMIDDSKAAPPIHVAFRNIVPYEFSQCTHLAGPMGFHEYIIDGKNNKLPPMIFAANSNFEATPLKIIFENCKGKVDIHGLTPDKINAVFENKCNEKELIVGTGVPSFQMK